MKLNDVQFCRVVPFVAFLHQLNEGRGIPTEVSASTPKGFAGKAWDNLLSDACEVIEVQSSRIAVRDFPEVVFEDETTRETTSIEDLDAIAASQDDEAAPADSLDAACARLEAKTGSRTEVPAFRAALGGDDLAGVTEDEDEDEARPRLDKFDDLSEYFENRD